jgi:hypothetical protein
MQELPCTNECTRTPIDVMNRIGKMVNEENGDIIEDVRATYIHILMYSQSNRIVELFAPNKKIQKLKNAFHLTIGVVGQKLTFFVFRLHFEK